MVLIGGHCVRYDEGHIQSKEGKHQADEELLMEILLKFSSMKEIVKIMSIMIMIISLYIGGKL